ncbi:branched-chain amino acid aminotransferase [Minwuia thermotolerans]|uniref:Probable branched-chain-amino-acid aminotransferase n=1 Tax=Minwuia thermotolerans TaxID=2056226 RepID=A0A2M9G5M5_9PROT|nr:branched-chain amino acid aminotransferase [Minwuia thermotolerans]PJK31011.1 branched chain amino acid aminotransferase [Minwuia thermotolerans]
MKQIFYYDGAWLDESPKLTGPMDHAFWMSSMVFDGARAFHGLAPDLRPHCERLIRSARSMLLAPPIGLDEVDGLCREAIRKLPKDGEYYVRPMFFAREGFVSPIPESTEFALAVYESPLPGGDGFAACLSSRRRPARDMAPTDAKAGCLYPNSQRALKEAADRGFDNAVIRDPSGNIAELATANLWIVRDGVAMTPVWNGTFLNGITRQRIIRLLGEAGFEVLETTLTHEDLMAADEIFSTGNYGKVTPMVRYEDRELQPGPVARRAREAYFDWAATERVI